MPGRGEALISSVFKIGDSPSFEACVMKLMDVKNGRYLPLTVWWIRIHVDRYRFGSSGSGSASALGTLLGS